MTKGKSFVLNITAITGSRESDHEDDAARRTPAGRRVATADAFLATRYASLHHVRSRARREMRSQVHRRGKELIRAFLAPSDPRHGPFLFCLPSVALVVLLARSFSPRLPLFLSRLLSLPHPSSPCSSGTLLRMWRGRRIARIYSILFLAHWRRTGAPMKVSSPLASFSVAILRTNSKNARISFVLITSSNLEGKKKPS